MDDLISRQAVLDLLQEEREEVHITSEAITKIRIAEINVEDLKAIPSVNVTEKTGRLITVDKGLMVTSYKCSECGRIVRDDTGYDVAEDYPYCHCGAKMEVEE